MPAVKSAPSFSALAKAGKARRAYLASVEEKEKADNAHGDAVTWETITASLLALGAPTELIQIVDLSARGKVNADALALMLGIASGELEAV